MRALITIALCLPLLATGCHRNQRDDQMAAQRQRAEPQAEAVTYPAPAPAYQQPPPAQRTCAGDSACAERELCVRGSCLEITANMAECGDVRVHFETDSAVLGQGDQDRLRRVARCLKSDQALHVTIAGSADRRGTEDYNYALGDRRATAVAGFLASLGVSESQLRTLSYGEDRPLCVENDQDCLARNRRASVRIKPDRTAGRRARQM